MNEFEARSQPIKHTPEDQRVVDLVNQVRGLAAASLIKAGLGSGYHIKPRFYSVEDRLKLIEADQQKIIDLARQLYPNQEILKPAKNLKWRQPNAVLTPESNQNDSTGILKPKRATPEETFIPLEQAWNNYNTERK